MVNDDSKWRKSSPTRAARSRRLFTNYHLLFQTNSSLLKKEPLDLQLSGVERGGVSQMALANSCGESPVDWAGAARPQVEPGL